MTVETETEVTKKAQDGVLEFLLINHPARLPGLRQGRRVPAPGPDHGVRAGRDPVRRGEAPLREADPDQRHRVPRPRALHPLRSLHPVRRRGGRRPADPLHGPGQPDPGQHLPRRALRVLLLAATPCRSARSARSRPSRTASRPARGTSRRSSRRAYLDSVGAGIVDPVVAQRGAAATWASTPTPSTGAGCPTRNDSPSRRINSADRLAAPAGARRRSTASIPTAPARGPAPLGRGGRSPLHSTPAPTGVAVIGGARLTNEAPVRLGQAGQGRDRHRQRRRPARRRPARRGRARPAPRHDRRRVRARRHHRPARARPQGRARRRSTSGCATPSSRTAPPSSSSRPQRHRPQPHAAEPRCATGPGESPAAVAAAASADSGAGGRPPGSTADATRRRPAASASTAPVTVVLGRPSLAESADRRRRRGRSLSPRLARRRVPVGAAPRQRPRRPRHGPGSRAPARSGPPSTAGRGRFADAWPTAPAADRPRHRRHPRGRGRRRDRRARPARRRPARRLPRSATWPDAGSTGAGTVIAVDLFAHRLGRLAADIVLAGGRLRRRSTAPPPTSRAGSARSCQKVTPPGTARPDWMIAAELAAGSAPISASTSRRRSSGPRSPPSPPSTRGARPRHALEADGRAVVLDPSGPPGVARGPEPPPWPPTCPTPTSPPARWSTRQLYDDGTLLAHCAVQRRPRRAGRPCAQPRRLRQARRRRRRHEVKVTSAAGRPHAAGRHRRRACPRGRRRARSAGAGVGGQRR